MKIHWRSVVVAAVMSTVALLSGEEEASAGPKDKDKDKDECLEAHGRGQDLRERGQLVRARQALMTCAQSACPMVVQADCARLSEEIAHVLPSVSFGARDVNGTDLPLTSVFVDDVLVATRLDDGKAYEIDPGKHVVRYTHDGREATTKIVLTQGEKGRVVVATFAAAGGPSPSSSTGVTPAQSTGFAPVIESRRSSVPLVFAGIGAAAAVTGAVMTGIGLSRVPSACSTSTNECATSSSDPAIAEARSGVTLANAGASIGIAGATVLIGSLVWYFLQPTTSAPSSQRASAMVVRF